MPRVFYSDSQYVNMEQTEISYLPGMPCLPS